MLSSIVSFSVLALAASNDVFSKLRMAPAKGVAPSVKSNFIFTEGYIVGETYDRSSSKCESSGLLYATGTGVGVCREIVDEEEKSIMTVFSYDENNNIVITDLHYSLENCTGTYVSDSYATFSNGCASSSSTSEYVTNGFFTTSTKVQYDISGVHATYYQSKCDCNCEKPHAWAFAPTDVCLRGNMLTCSKSSVMAESFGYSNCSSLVDAVLLDAGICELDINDDYYNIENALAHFYDCV